MFVNTLLHYTTTPAKSLCTMPKYGSMQIRWWPAALDSEMPLSDWRMMRARELRPYGTNKISSNIAYMFGCGAGAACLMHFPGGGAVLQCCSAPKLGLAVSL